LQQRAECASRLQALGKALYNYSVENRGVFPPNLAALATLSGAQRVSPDIFICPAHPVAIPANWNAMSVEKKGEWITAATSWAYRGSGMSNSRDSATLVLAHERFLHDGNGVNVLFGDGSVTFEITRNNEENVRRLNLNLEPEGKSDPDTAIDPR
jgi:prepilin-type processing-associated H-X9-DG protein